MRGDLARREGGRGAGRVALSHLVAASPGIDEYRQKAPRSADNRTRVVMDGPRAPYSFASFIPRKGFAPVSAA